MKELLRTTSLSFQYPEIEQSALTEINLTIEEGQIMSLVGESGSGKTTLLKAIAGLLEPSSGQILFNGKPLPPPSRRLVPGHPDIRMVFQDFGLAPKLNVYDNIDHVLRAYTVEYRQQRVEELLVRCRLTGLEYQFPQMLSGGEKQRLALARALAEEPRLLLMDEPFGQLDTLLKQQLKFELADFLAESSMTMVMVTHEPRDALGIADTIAVLQNGQIVQLASPQKIYETPLTPYVGQLFGTLTIFPLRQWQEWDSSLSNTTSPFLGIRAEHVQINTLKDSGVSSSIGACYGMPATVLKVSYQGFYQEVILQMPGEQLLTAFHQGTALTETQSVRVIIDSKNLIPFAENNETIEPR